MVWSQCYWRLVNWQHNIKEYHYPQWDVSSDWSKQSIYNAWVEATKKSNRSIKIRLTCQNGKYIVLDTRED